MKTTFGVAALWFGVAALCLSTLVPVPLARAQTPEFMIDFRNPAHRAQVVEEGLEFVAAYPDNGNPRWALYRVTSATPRLRFPGAVVPPDPADWGHRTRVCTGGGYATDQYEELLALEEPCIPSGISGTCTTPVATIAIELRANVVPYGGGPAVDREIGDYFSSAAPFPKCWSDGDVGGGIGTMEPVTGIYVQVIPAHDNDAVPLGAIIPLRMVAIGNGLETTTHDRPPQMCCESELECTVEPYCGDGVLWRGVEVCDDGNNIDGDGCSADCSTIEPPGGGGPTEPPGGNPYCGNGVVDDGEVCDHGGGEFSNCLDDCSGYAVEPTGLNSNGGGAPQACQNNVANRTSPTPLVTLFLLGLVALMRRRARGAAPI